MAVCQGCGRACNSDLCCPTCMSLSRSSFFCSQECFAGNWKEHGKLHAILKQQMKLTEVVEEEKKKRGMSAASSALSALSDMLSGKSAKPSMVVSSVSKRVAAEGTYKDHEMKPLDKLIGPNGMFRGFRVLLLLTVILFFIFLKINDMISEIPTALQRASERKISDTLSVPSGNSGSMLVSPALVESNERLPVEDSNETVKRLRGEVESLRSKLNSLAKKTEQVDSVRPKSADIDNGDSVAGESASTPLKQANDALNGVEELNNPPRNGDMDSGPKYEIPNAIDEGVANSESVGMVRDDHLMRLLQEKPAIGQVRFDNV